MFRNFKDTTQLEPAHEADLRLIAFMATALIQFKHRGRFFTDVEPGYNPDAIISNTAHLVQDLNHVVQER
jgi:hypothetical protein